MIIGIDLGTTHSLAAIWREGRAELVPNALGEFLTPSVVSIDKDESILVGRAARERLQSHPSRTAAAFKRAMGTAKQFDLASRRFRAEELSSLVLRALKADAEALLGEAVHEAVITVPAYFSDAQRQATRSAGAMAGFTQISLLNEPTAAALAYGLNQRDSETQFLVFDLGGGTFDVSILEMFDGVMEVRATAGDNHLGGEDVDELLVSAFIAHTKLPQKLADDAELRAQIAARVEAAKRALETKEGVTVSVMVQQQEYAMPLTAEGLASAIAPLLDRLRAPIERALRDAKIRSSELEAVVLAGGSTRLRAVRQLVARMFGRFPETAINPDEVVAMGAAVQAGLKMNDVALSERVLTDVCPYTLGIETSRHFGDGRLATGFMAPILDRNTVIPASRVQRFSPVADFQSLLRIAVYQGEARRVKDNILLGQFDLEMPKGRVGEVGADVRFTYDASGLLEVEATPVKDERPAGAPQRLVIENSTDRLTPEEIAMRLAALKQLKIHPRERLEIRTLFARAERLHGQLLGQMREQLADAISRFELALDTQGDRHIAPARKQLEALVAAVEKDRFLVDEDQ
jgi:molecular chaperone HscC